MIRSDLIEKYQRYEVLLEELFLAVFKIRGYKYSIFFGVMLAQSIGRITRGNLDLSQIDINKNITFKKGYGEHLEEFMNIQGEISLKKDSAQLTFIKLICYLLYFIFVFLKIKILNCRMAIDTCVTKPSPSLLSKIYFCTHQVVPPPFPHIIILILGRLFAKSTHLVTEEYFNSEFRFFIKRRSDLDKNDIAFLHYVLSTIPKISISHFQIFSMVSSQVYRNFQLELQNLFYFDELIKHSIAGAALRNNVLRVVQHGGGYGILDGNVYELFETQQFGESFIYLDPCKIKIGDLSAIPPRWRWAKHKSAVSKKMRRKILLVLARNYTPRETLHLNEDWGRVNGLILQIDDAAKSVGLDFTLDILPYAAQAAMANKLPAVIGADHIHVIVRPTDAYSVDDYCCILMDNFGSMFYELLVRGYEPVVINSYAHNMYQKDWLDRVGSYIKEGFFIDSTWELNHYLQAKLRQVY